MIHDPQPAIDRFIDSRARRPTLGLVYGRRRIGKSTLLHRVTQERGGFYWEATRAESAIHLARLGEALGSRLGLPALRLERWEDAFAALLSLDVPVVVLDEFGYLLEAEPGLDSVVASALGPGRRQDRPARLIVCGSALALMGALTAGEAPLRGRAGLELVMQPLDFRAARAAFVPAATLDVAVALHSVIGGVIGYGTDMVDFDLPRTSAEFEPWLFRRLLSPAAPLFNEATTLLAEDPTVSAAAPALQHSILGTIANGNVTAGSIANRLRRGVPGIDPALKRLISAGFVLRDEDPARAKRPVYSLADPFLQFHYAILEPHGALLRDRGAEPVWRERLRAIYDSRVRGPAFEAMARTWARRFASAATLGTDAPLVGASSVSIDGVDHELDVMVTTTVPDQAPTDRAILAIGEAKAGAELGLGHLRRLERARAALGPRASQARLLLYAPRIDRALRSAARQRHDVELIDLERLYDGA